MQIALCDDEKEQINLLRRLLMKWSADKPFTITIAEYNSAEEFLFKATPHNPVP